MKILVTGSKGMIGSYVVRGLCSAGFNVIGADRTETDDSTSYIHCRVDINDAIAVQNVFQKFAIDKVVHLAALAHSVNGRGYTWERYKKNNVDGALNVFNAAVAIPVLFTSTVDVYGFVSGVVNQFTLPQPVSYYAKSKLLAENECKKLKQYDIFRLSPVYTDDIKRDIQKRYYLRYPNIAYIIGNGMEYEILNISMLVNEIIAWCKNSPNNGIKILKDSKYMKTTNYIAAEQREGRANIVIRCPKVVAEFLYLLTRTLTGRNRYTYLLHKALRPIRSE